jgi:deazaflavin-dependent oxidoreductase (nitroreductase family)
MAVRGFERFLLQRLGTAQGWRIDARILHLTGHSPYGYLYGKDLGGSRGTYRPPLALTTIGHRTGELHAVALAYFAVDDGWAVIGSAHGSPTEPHWVRNLRANPAAWVRLQRHTTPVTATVLDGDDKAPLWERITSRAPLFAAFQDTAARDIPVVVLRPRSAGSGPARYDQLK